MAPILKDRVQETTNSPGTGDVSLAGAVIGFQTFSSAIGNGNTCYYVIADQAGSNWEIGIGTYVTSGNVLQRTTVLSSSAGGTTKENFSTGAQNVFVTYPASKSVNLDEVGVANIADAAITTAAIGTATLTSGTISTQPSGGTDIANKNYVDTLAGEGLTIHSPVFVESPSTVGNLNATYTNGGTTPTWTDITGNKELVTGSAHSLSINDVIVFGTTTNGITAGTAYFVKSTPTATSITLSLAYNGSEITSLTNGTGLTITSRANSGVGATLTNAGTQAALVIDGVTLTTTQRVLIYNQTSAFQNGVYTVTNTGSGSTNWVLTRATTENKYAPTSVNSLGRGDYFYVEAGDTGKGESYVFTAPSGTIVFGTTNLTFTQFSSAQIYTAGTGLSLSGNAFSLATNYGDTLNPYASKAQHLVLASPDGSSGQPTFRALVPADVPTLNQNTTGSAATATTATNQSGGTVSATSITDSGNLTFTGTGNRITGDFSNATEANKVMFQTSTTNAATVVSVIPNGTTANAQLRVYNNSDPTNAAAGILTAQGAVVTLQSAITGTGTYLPLTMYTGGSERLRIATSGDVTIGSGTTAGDTLRYLDITNTNTGTSAGAIMRFVTSNSAGSGNTSVDVVKYKTGAFVINNNDSAGTTSFGTAGSERMRITSTGDVGINTSTPTAKLSVNGSGNGTANATSLYAYGSTALATTLDAMAYPAEIGNSDGGNNSRLLFALRRTVAAGTNWTTAAWRIQPAVDASFTGAGSNKGYLELAYGDSGAYRGIGLSGTGTTTPDLIVNQAGNVGLGLTSPNFRLDASGSIAAGAGTITFPTTNTGTGYFSKGVTSNGGFLIQDGNGRLNQYWNAYTDSGGYKYTVTGEASARYAMSVSGTTGAVHAWYGAPAGTAGTALTWTQMGQMISGTGGSIWFSQRGTSSDFVINASGDIGIGTSSPSSTLTVGGNPPAAGALAAVGAASGISLALSDNINCSMYVRHPAAGPIIGTDGGNALRFATNGNATTDEKMRITSAGGISFGSSGTAYGTSGQVLTSAGDGTPTWTTPATGTVTSVGGTGTVNGITLTGSVTSSGNLTLGGTLSGVSLTTQVSGTLPVGNGGTGITSFGAGVATFLGTPSSANLFAAMTDDTGTGLLTFNTTPTFVGLRETRIAIPASDINLSTGNYFTRTISGVTTLTVSNVPATGTANSFILDLTNGGSATVNWWTGVKWAGGTPPTLTAAGRDALGFYTYDGGTTWTGLVLGKDIK